MKIAEAVKAQLKKRLSDSQKRLAKHFLYSLLYKKNLAKLAVAFGTDKEGRHHYAKHYQRHFGPLQHEKLNVLEIGIGETDNPKGGGASLRMWKAYFPNSRIFGIDIYDKSYHDDHRIKTFRGSQEDERFLRKVVDEIGAIDIVIDDGSHLNNHVITTFKILFPLLSSNGIYAVEDLHTSYCDVFAGQSWDGSRDLSAPHTSMNFLKGLIDGLNHEEFMADEFTPGYFEKYIVAMHFYHNLAFIYKGLNNEGGNNLGRRFS